MFKNVTRSNRNRGRTNRYLQTLVDIVVSLKVARSSWKDVDVDVAHRLAGVRPVLHRQRRR